MRECCSEESNWLGPTVPWLRVNTVPFAFLSKRLASGAMAAFSLGLLSTSSENSWNNFHTERPLSTQNGHWLVEQIPVPQLPLCASRFRMTLSTHSFPSGLTRTGRQADAPGRTETDTLRTRAPLSKLSNFARRSVRGMLRARSPREAIQRLRIHARV